MQISQATKPVINRLNIFEARMESSFDTLDEKTDALRWLIGAVGIVLGAAVCVAFKVLR